MSAFLQTPLEGRGREGLISMAIHRKVSGEEKQMLIHEFSLLLRAKEEEEEEGEGVDKSIFEILKRRLSANKLVFLLLFELGGKDGFLSIEALHLSRMPGRQKYF